MILGSADPVLNQAASSASAHMTKTIGTSQAMWDGVGLCRLSLLVNVTLLGIGHKMVGFPARGLLCLQ